MICPAVAWFAEQMEAKLRANDHKADWLTQHPVILLDLLRDEVRELRNALDDNVKVLDANEVVREAADVANFAMMIADHYGKRIGSGRDGERLVQERAQANVGDDFSAWWAVWPSGHRVGRKQALAQWQKLSAGDRAVALESVRWRVANDRRWQAPAADGLWAIPHPFRWLRDRRFEDARQAARGTIVTDAHRKAAADLRRRAYTRCPHDPACLTYHDCIELLAREMAGERNDCPVG